jgi:hypothetical protein
MDRRSRRSANEGAETMWRPSPRRTEALSPTPGRSGGRSATADRERAERNAVRQWRCHDARCREADDEIRALWRLAPASR